MHVIAKRLMASTTQNIVSLLSETVIDFLVCQ
jgi:hypothetical protein